ncbi:carboxypeptidase-like regulatory domain-containing protein [bacterium]|nr:carboxypeptidase-like regulatory domain-containing protein [bacterium]
MRPGPDHHLTIPDLKALILSLLFLAVPGPGHAADPVIRLQYENVPLREALQDISDRTGTQFIFMDSLIQNTTVTCRTDSVPMNEALKLLFGGTGLGYQIVRTQSVVLFEDRSRLSTIRGNVTDAKNGCSLPYANILIKGTQHGTASDENGHFEIEPLSSESDTLQIRYMGYQEKQVVGSSAEENRPVHVALDEKILEGENISVSANHIQGIEIGPGSGRIRFDAPGLAEIPSLPGSHIENTLQMLPFTSGFSDRTGEFHIQGGNIHETRILVDGIPVYCPWQYYGLVSMFPSGVIGDVTVHTGGFGARYGNALSGVVQLTGNTGSGDSPELVMESNLFSIQGFMKIPVSKSVRITAGGSRSYNNITRGDLYENSFAFARGYSNLTFDLFSDDRSALFHPYMFSNIFGKISFVPSDRCSLSVTGFTAQDREDILNLVDYGEPATQRCEIVYSSLNLGTSGNLNVRWNSHFLSDINVAMTRFRKNDRTEAHGILTETCEFVADSLMISTLRSSLEEVCVKNENAVNFSGSTHYFGCEFTSVTVRNPYSRNNRRNIRKPAFFIETGLKPPGRIDLILGFRTTNFETAEPRLGTKIALSQTFTFYSRWGRYSQWIQPYEDHANPLARYDSFIGSWLMSGDGIETALSEHRILGLNTVWRNWVIQTEYYDKIYDNLCQVPTLYKVPETTGNDSPPVSYGSGSSRGMQIMVQKNAGPYSGWITVHFSDVQIRFPGVNRGKAFRPGYNQDYMVKSHHRLLTGPWCLGVNTVFGSGLRYTPFTDPDLLNMDHIQRFYETDRMNTGQFRSYRRIDVLLTGSLNPCRYLKGSAGIGLLNCFDLKNKYYRFYNAPGDNGPEIGEGTLPGRTFVFQLRLELNP